MRSERIVLSKTWSTKMGRLWMRSHRGDGRRNEDWFGWRADVLSPCTCEVVKVTINSIVNEPGVLGKPPAVSAFL